jgi:hypothetical protein
MQSPVGIIKITGGSPLLCAYKSRGDDRDGDENDYSDNDA